MPLEYELLDDHDPRDLPPWPTTPRQKLIDQQEYLTGSVSPIRIETQTQELPHGSNDLT